MVHTCVVRQERHMERRKGHMRMHVASLHACQQQRSCSLDSPQARTCGPAFSSAGEGGLVSPRPLQRADACGSTACGGGAGSSSNLQAAARRPPAPGCPAPAATPRAGPALRAAARRGPPCSVWRGRSRHGIWPVEPSWGALAGWLHGHGGSQQGLHRSALPPQGTAKGNRCKTMQQE